jgi:hypothetical protein
LKLENVYVFSMSKIKNGVIVSRKKARSANFDDIDVVVKRVSRALVQDVEVAKDARVDDVTEDEVTLGKRRIETIDQRFFGFGPAGLNSLNTSKTAVRFEFGQGWNLDSQFMLKLGLSGTFAPDTNVFMGDTSLGGDYNFNDKNNSPFLTLDLGYGIANAHHSKNTPTPDRETINGFVASAGAGMKFFRVSKVNLVLTVKYQQMFNRNDDGMPSAVTGVVSIFFPGGF